MTKLSQDLNNKAKSRHISLRLHAGQGKTFSHEALSKQLALLVLLLRSAVRIRNAYRGPDQIIPYYTPALQQRF